MTLSERLLNLVSISSVTGDEKQICDELHRYVESSHHYTVLRRGNSLALYPQRRSAKPLVAFVGHLDTVPPSVKNPPRIEGDRLYGLGASDMKSGVALMWDFLDWDPQTLSYDLAFLFYDGEEGPYEQSGLSPLLDHLSWAREIALAFCLEPSSNKLQLGCMGTIHATVRFHGHAAHSARPWQGENAIHSAGPLLMRLRELQPVDVRFGELLYREVVSATMAKGGTARNVVPDRFEINLNYRFAPGRSVDSAKIYLQQLVDTPTASIDFVDVAPSGPIPEGNTVLEHFRRVCPVPVEPKQAWTDVARLAAYGIPAVNFGPGQSEKAHQPDEFALISKLEEGAHLFRNFLRNF